MAAPASGVCGPWIDDIDVACCSDADKRADAITLATALLFRFSGRQFPGECERTVRPCNTGGCSSGRGQFPAVWDYAIWDAVIGYWTAGTPAYPARIGGEWYNLPVCGGNCWLPSVPLPGPIVSVSEVVVDGQILDPSAYQVEADRSVVRVDGKAWPCSQNYTLNSGPGGDPGTWQTTYVYGRGPGSDGEVVCRLFACEIARFLCGGPCALPSRVTRLAREGVDVILDPLTHVDKEQTGIPLVDSWLMSVNPSKLHRRSVVRRLDSPDRLGRIE